MIKQVVLQNNAGLMGNVSELRVTHWAINGCYVVELELLTALSFQPNFESIYCIQLNGKCSSLEIPLMLQRAKLIETGQVHRWQLTARAPWGAWQEAMLDLFSDQVSGQTLFQQLLRLAPAWQGQATTDLSDDLITVNGLVGDAWAILQSLCQHHGWMHFLQMTSVGWQWYLTSCAILKNNNTSADLIHENEVITRHEVSVWLTKQIIPLIQLTTVSLVHVGQWILWNNIRYWVISATIDYDASHPAGSCYRNTLTLIAWSQWRELPQEVQLNLCQSEGKHVSLCTQTAWQTEMLANIATNRVRFIRCHEREYPIHAPIIQPQLGNDTAGLHWPMLPESQALVIAAESTQPMLIALGAILACDAYPLTATDGYDAVFSTLHAGSISVWSQPHLKRLTLQFHEQCIEWQAEETQSTCHIKNPTGEIHIQTAKNLSWQAEKTISHQVAKQHSLNVGESISMTIGDNAVFSANQMDWLADDSIHITSKQQTHWQAEKNIELTAKAFSLSHHQGHWHIRGEKSTTIQAEKVNITTQGSIQLSNKKSALRLEKTGLMIQGRELACHARNILFEAVTAWKV